MNIPISSQDLFVDRLVERVDKLKEEIAMYEAQLTAQLEETKAAKEQLMEAHMEMEVTVDLKDSTNILLVQTVLINQLNTTASLIFIKTMITFTLSCL